MQGTRKKTDEKEKAEKAELVIVKALSALKVLSQIWKSANKFVKKMHYSKFVFIIFSHKNLLLYNFTNSTMEKRCHWDK